MYTVVGLGNPGEEYSRTRHNVGRMAADAVEQKVEKIKVLAPDTFMNRSGSFVAKYIKSKKAAEKLILIHDDLDLPLGKIKISYNRSSGGHKGVESVVRALKTEEFVRIRIGISVSTPSGKLKKPKGESEVNKYVLGDFKKSDEAEVKKILKRVVEIVETISKEGLPIAQNKFNQ